MSSLHLFADWQMNRLACWLRLSGVSFGAFHHLRRNSQRGRSYQRISCMLQLCKCKFWWMIGRCRTCQPTASSHFAAVNRFRVDQVLKENVVKSRKVWGALNSGDKLRKKSSIISKYKILKIYRNLFIKIYMNFLKPLYFVFFFGKHTFINELYGGYKFIIFWKLEDDFIYDVSLHHPKPNSCLSHHACLTDTRYYFWALSMQFSGRHFVPEGSGLSPLKIISKQPLFFHEPCCKTIASFSRMKSAG